MAILPSEELLVIPCKAVEAGDTVRSLGIGYVVNTKCIHMYEDRMELLREWKSKKESLYNKNK